MKILVTGATGFVGTNIVKKLSMNHEVATLNARAIKGNTADWHELVDQTDVIIHLAGLAHITSNESSTNRHYYSEVNTELTKILAERLAVSGRRRFIFLSSARVYGNFSKNYQSFKPNDDLNPTSPYAVSKVEAEEALNALSKYCKISLSGGLAQLVEQRTLNPFVASSTLASPTTNISLFVIISIKI